MTNIENVKTNLLSVYPNPSNGIFNISPSIENLSNAKISVMNVNGQTAFSTVLQENSGKINLRSLGKGLFFEIKYRFYSLSF